MKKKLICLLIVLVLSLEMSINVFALSEADYNNEVIIQKIIDGVQSSLDEIGIPIVPLGASHEEMVDIINLTIYPVHYILNRIIATLDFDSPLNIVISGVFNHVFFENIELYIRVSDVFSPSVSINLAFCLRTWFPHMIIPMEEDVLKQFLEAEGLSYEDIDVITFIGFDRGFLVNQPIFDAWLDNPVGHIQAAVWYATTDGAIFISPSSQWTNISGTIFDHRILLSLTEQARTTVGSGTARPTASVRFLAAHACRLGTGRTTFSDPTVVISTWP